MIKNILDATVSQEEEILKPNESMLKRFRDRYSLASLASGETDDKGRLFMMPRNQVDLSDVRILHDGVDTVRQLYAGMPIAEVVDAIADLYSSGFNQIVDFAGIQWALGSGGQSGYRWRLQNNELGLIMFFGSRYVDLDKSGAHLKIDCSPSFLLDFSSRSAQARMDQLASALLHDPKPSGVAIHIAVDIQGWAPPADFERRLTTRSKRRVVYEGLESLEFIGAETVQRYGDRETFMFGSAGSVQFCMYRKDREAHKQDKLDFWEDQWRDGAEPDSDVHDYVEGAPVWRLEWRFHHTVLQQIEGPDGKHGSFLSYALAAPALTNIFQYGLRSFRLDWNRSWIDPMWQLLYEDIHVLGEVEKYEVRRIYKTEGRGDERNLVLILGNMITVYARYGYQTSQVIGYLRGAGLWDEIRKYLMSRHHDPQEYISRGLALRRLVGKAA